MDVNGTVEPVGSFVGPQTNQNDARRSVMSHENIGEHESK